MESLYQTQCTGTATVAVCFEQHGINRKSSWRFTSLWLAFRMCLQRTWSLNSLTGTVTRCARTPKYIVMVLTVENILFSFSSFRIRVEDLDNLDYTCASANLYESIDPARSSVKVNSCNNWSNVCKGILHYHTCVTGKEGQTSGYAEESERK